MMPGLDLPSIRERKFIMALEDNLQKLGDLNRRQVPVGGMIRSGASMNRENFWRGSGLISFLTTGASSSSIGCGRMAARTSTWRKKRYREMRW